MQTRKFGNSNVRVSAPELGRTGMSFGYGAQVLPAVEQLGIRFVPYSPLGNGFIRSDGSDEQRR